MFYIVDLAGVRLSQAYRRREDAEEAYQTLGEILPGMRLRIDFIEDVEAGMTPLERAEEALEQALYTPDSWLRVNPNGTSQVSYDGYVKVSEAVLSLSRVAEVVLKSQEV